MPQRKLTKEPFFQNSKTIMGHHPPNPNFKFIQQSKNPSGNLTKPPSHPLTNSSFVCHPPRRPRSMRAPTLVFLHA